MVSERLPYFRLHITAFGPVRPTADAFEKGWLASMMHSPILHPDKAPKDVNAVYKEFNRRRSFAAELHHKAGSVQPVHQSSAIRELQNWQRTGSESGMSKKNSPISVSLSNGSYR